MNNEKSLKYQDNSPYVCILMAVYNGEKYIRRQIDSIINQDYHNWFLAIQDDGSSDDTASIIKEYEKNDNRIKLFKNDGLHGAYYNFHGLANRFKNNSDFDYFMFSDQDDVWYVNKISIFIDRMSYENKKTPVLCYADMQVVDGEGSVLFPSINSTYHIDLINKKNVFLMHRVFGCNTIINRRLFDLVPVLPITKDIQKLSHDNFYTKFAVVFGKLVFLNKITMDFVRHGNNTTNQQEYKPTVKRIVKRLLSLSELSAAHANHYNQSIFTINLMRRYYSISKEAMGIVDEQENVINSGGIIAIRYLIKNHIVWGSIIESISRYFILFTGLYKKFL